MNSSFVNGVASIGWKFGRRPVQDVGGLRAVDVIVRVELPREIGQARLQSDAEGEVAGAHAAAVAIEAKRPPLEPNLADPIAETQGGQSGRHPGEVLREFPPRHRLELGVEELVEALLRHEIGQEAPGARRVHGRDEILEEGGLERDLRQHHAGVPVEGRSLIEDQRVEVVDRVELRREDQVERADADAGEVERVVRHDARDPAWEAVSVTAWTGAECSARWRGLIRSLPSRGTGRTGASP